MTWQVTWSLILGFTLSAIIEALVRKSTIVRLLPNDRPRSLVTAAVLGAASSSCSYAAVALARSLFRKGADFSAAMTFQIASTNLVIELGLILALLIGWRFTLAEFVGGPIMIVLLALLFRRFLSKRLRAAAVAQSEKGVAGSPEGHAAMDMSITATGSLSGSTMAPPWWSTAVRSPVRTKSFMARPRSPGCVVTQSQRSAPRDPAPGQLRRIRQCEE